MYILRLEFKADFSEITAASNEQVLDDFSFQKPATWHFAHLVILIFCWAFRLGCMILPVRRAYPSPNYTIARKQLGNTRKNLETNHVHHVIQQFSFSCSSGKPGLFSFFWAGLMGMFSNTRTWEHCRALNYCTCFKQIPLSNFKIFRSYDINSQSKHDIMYKWYFITHDIISPW